MKFKTMLFAGALCAALSVPFASSAYAQSPAPQQEAQAQEEAQAPSQGQEQSWTGKIEAKEMGGQKVYVFTVGGKSYTLQPQDKAADFEGKTVKVTGKMAGNTVTISSIEEA